MESVECGVRSIAQEVENAECEVLPKKWKMTCTKHSLNGIMIVPLPISSLSESSDH